MSPNTSTVRMPARPLTEAIRAYWNAHIHDLEIARHPIGTKGFFEDLAAYRYEKLAYLPRVVDFTAYRGQRLLEVGCGVGLDLVRFARHGAIVTGVDLAEVAIDLARQHFALSGVDGELLVIDGEDLRFDSERFDVVYAHGVLQYTADAPRMLSEIRRVLKPGGQAIVMVYHRYSWLTLMATLFGVPLEHADAPVLKTYSIREFRTLLRGFSCVQIIPERFPVQTRLHHGLKARLYNGLFVAAFQRIPKPLVRPFGWHLMAMAIK